MINIKESFGILAKALALEGVRVEPDDLRSLKFGDRKAVTPVLENVIALLAKFGPLKPPALKITCVEDAMSALGLQASKKLPAETALLLIFIWVVLKYRVMERLEKLLLSSFISFNTGQQRKDEWSSNFSPKAQSMVKAKFSEGQKESTALVHAISSQQRRIELLQKHKQQKLDRIKSLLSTQRFASSSELARPSALARKLELYNLIQSFPGYKECIYLWFCDIAQTQSDSSQARRLLLKQSLICQDGPLHEFMSHVLPHKKYLKSFIKKYKAHLQEAESMALNDKHPLFRLISTLTSDKVSVNCLDMVECIERLQHLHGLSRKCYEKTVACQLERIVASVSNVSVKRVNC